MTKLRELFLFIKLFVATMMEISKNNLLKRGIESDITSTNIFGDVSQYIYMFWKLMALTKQQFAK